MSRILLVVIVCALVMPLAQAQDSNSQGQVAASPEESAIRQQLKAYLEAFNQHDAAAVAKFWTLDCASLAEDSNERITGRDALQERMAGFFKGQPDAQMTGEITNIKIVRPDVALLEGTTTLLLADSEPVVSTYSALLIKEGDLWLISNSREHDALPPQTAREALQGLEWLIGSWQDQSGNGTVTTTFRWSANEAFLIRSFTEQAPDQDALEGTQVIGWDPRSGQIRAWTFNSDGSFGEGTISRHDDDWLLKMWQINPDGELASATQVISRVDDDTLTVQIIGETVDGEPSATSDPVTVVRIKESAAEATPPASSEQGAKP